MTITVHCNQCGTETPKLLTRSFRGYFRRDTCSFDLCPPCYDELSKRVKLIWETRPDHPM